MGLLDLFFRPAQDENKGNAYNLEKDEQDLVDSGEYDPWNFEEEDLEEDDYSYEDDLE